MNQKPNTNNTKPETTEDGGYLLPEPLASQMLREFDRALKRMGGDPLNPPVGLATEMTFNFLEIQ